MKKILLVDDEQMILDLLRTLLKVDRSDYQVSEALDGASAIEAFSHDPADMVILDLRLPGMSGLDVLREMRKTKPDVRAILMTAYLDEDLPVEAEDEVVTFLRKPFRDINKVTDVIDHALRTEQQMD